MIVNVRLLPHENHVKEVELENGSTGQELLETLNLAFDAHILTRKDIPIPIDEELKDRDEIAIIKVVSGG